ncbi:MAG TPA: hypothetical protein VMY37_05845 [Thermoguttaceae bacterium]|nr:hypothetical protein [Thermoguttaceae bacterium]
MLRNLKWARIAPVALLAAGLLSGGLAWAKKPPKPPPEPPPSPITYEITWLDTLGGSSSYAYDVNNGGAVELADGEFHAFIYTAESGMVDLNFDEAGNDLFPLWHLRAARGINDLGWIVGQGYVDGEEHAFRYIPQEGDTPLIEDLGKLYSDHVCSVGYDVNLLGEVCGFSRDNTSQFGDDHAFYHAADPADQTDMVDILGGLPSHAEAINLHGETIGYLRDASYRAVFRSSRGATLTFFFAPSTLDNAVMEACDINDSGHFVGRAAFQVNKRKHETRAYRHDGVSILDLGVAEWTAYGINNVGNGDVVGMMGGVWRYDNLRFPGFPYLDELDVLVDLDYAVEDTPDDLAKWQVASSTRPEAINDYREICGHAADGSIRGAFLLTPVSP